MSRSSSRPQAVILAAGRGNRLLPYTKDRPKCLLEVGGRTIIEHQIRALNLAGVTEIQVVLGFSAELVRETCGDRVSYAVNELYDSTNSFDSLGCVTLEPGEAGMLVMNSDVLFHPDLMRTLLDDPRENVLLADYDAQMREEEMKIVVDGEQRITAISKKLDPATAQAENLGLIRLGTAAARRMLELGATRDRDLGISWVPDGIHYLREEFAFYAKPIPDLPWTEIDFIHDLERARGEVFPQIEAALWGERSGESGAGAAGDGAAAAEASPSVRG